MKKFLPAILFVVVIIFLYQGIGKNPHVIPSALINKPVPAFNLKLLDENLATFNQEDLKGNVSLINVWATWCFACKDEHDVLLNFSKTYSTPIYGLNYKDDLTDVKQWLAEQGNPYKKILLDEQGNVAIDFGVYGTPETFVIDKNGVIQYKHVGPLTEKLLQSEIIPLIKQLEAIS